MTNLLSKLKMLSKTDIAAIILISAAFIYLFVMASFDGTVSDEAFYISIPFRLMKGDGLFTDEWHLSQLSAVLLYLPVKLFTGITGTTEGIILFMRRLFCIMQFTVGAFTYKTFRKEGFVSVIISLSFMLYSVIGLNTLSYNTMGVALLLVIICISYNLSQNPSIIKMFALGFLIAMFILCQPLGVVFYGIFFVAVIIINISCQKNKKTTPYPFKIKSLLATVAGILPVFVFFLYLLFKNSDITTIIECIPGIFSDIEHMKLTDTLGEDTFSVAAFFSDMALAAGTSPLILTVVFMIAAIFLKNKSKYISVIFVSLSLILFTLIFYYRFLFLRDTTETNDVNFFFLPLALSGPFFYLLCDRKNHKVFILFWCTGIMYALFMTISSNLQLHASVNGYIISAAGSILLAKNLLTEIKKEDIIDALKKSTSVLLTVTVFGFTVFNAAVTITYSVTLTTSFQGAKLTKGIYKEIKLPSDQALIYTNIYDDARKLKESVPEDSNLFVVENIPAVYLETSLKMGTHSGWFIAEQLFYPEIRDRFRNYYEINPDNLPSYIYVPAYAYTEFGLKSIPPKKLADFAYMLFEGEAEDIGNGLLIKVTGIKDE